MVARPDPTAEISTDRVSPTNHALLPVVVIVGRPNVGKSTLFNAITGTRRSIVGDEPGITRDRIQGEASYLGKRFELIDTGGIIQNDAELIPSQILKQARVALDQASQIIFLIDGRTEITGADRDLAKMLRRIAKPVSLAVNKMDTTARESLAHEFHALGFPNLFPISAEHRIGLDDLLEHVTRDFPKSVDDSKPAPETNAIKVAIIGRPNVGKSTLLNALTGSERSIVSPIPGTTRDAVDERVVRHGVEFVFVDTAGIRRKGKTHLMAEKLSVVMARRHIRMANVVVLVLDAAEGIVGSDATIAGYAHEEGRGVVLCVNKWDLHGEKGKRKFTETLRDELKFLDYAAVAFISAKTGEGVKGLFRLIEKSFASASRRVTTGELNRFVETLEPSRDIKIHYMTQASVRPPAFVVFTSAGNNMHFSTERYLINQLRKRFDFEGTPIVIKARRR
jgi:GTP-binding protein